MADQLPSLTARQSKREEMRADLPAFAASKALHWVANYLWDSPQSKPINDQSLARP